MVVGKSRFDASEDLLRNKLSMRRKSFEQNFVYLRYVLHLYSPQEPSLQTFNVVEEHRHWCPWIFEDEANSDESAKKSEPGWRRVLNSLLNADDRNDKLLQV